MSKLAAHINAAGSARLRPATLLAIVALLLPPACAAATVTRPVPAGVRIWTIHYTAHNGRDRLAWVVLPSWYGPGRNPPIPLVISPHGRGATGRSNADFFGATPAAGGFAVVSPDGMGRRLRYFSYGFPGQIDDLARMPELVEHALPWLRIDRTRIYALGSSMGGQETLLLVARHPRLLAGAVAMDSVTDLARRYAQLPTVPCDARCLARWKKPRGIVLQSTMRREVGGTPAQVRGAYASRSGLDQAARIAASGVPLQIWWSTQDKIVKDQLHQSGAMFAAVRRLDPCAPVSEFVGTWAHSTEMRAAALLPIALRELGLIDSDKPLPASVRHVAAPQCSV